MTNQLTIPHDEIINLIKQGDELAMRHVFDQYYARLHYFAISITGKEEEADDLVQETFVNFWVNIREKGVVPENIPAYLYGIVRNCCLLYLRRQKRIDQQGAEVIERFYEDMEKNLDDIALREELYYKVSRHFSQLTPIQAQVMKLLYLDELSVQEIAKRLNTTDNNIRNHKARAIERLKGLVEGEILLMLIFFEKFL